MNIDELLFNKENTSGTCSSSEIRKGNLDMIVLKYMARRVYVAAQHTDILQTEQPQLCILQERHRRIHRIAIYSADALHKHSDMLFVGFISKKRVPLSPTISEDIENIDKRLLIELGNNPGLLSYSSLQFRSGNWCNLVLFRDNEAKKHVRNTEVHSHAAYQLAPRYYEWVRLHNGTLTGGIAQGIFALQKTRLYTFHTAHTAKPVVQELVYE